MDEAQAVTEAARAQLDQRELQYLLKEKAHLEVRAFKVTTAIELLRRREAADAEFRAFRMAEGV
jgi:hypothetical protein